MNIGIIIAIAVGFALIKFATGLIFKVLGFLALLFAAILFLYQMEIWPFEKNLATIKILELRYCDGNEEDKIKCDCIVQPLKLDINKRFNREELEALNANRIKTAYILKKSLDAKELEIKACLASKGKEHLFAEFKRELIAQESDLLKKFGNWLEKGKENLSESVNELKEYKEDIDTKYD
jgi:hypothetical protein